MRAEDAREQSQPSNDRIEFKQGADGAVVALVFHQPNGSFEAVRVA